MDKVLSNLRRIAQTYPTRGTQDAVVAAVDEIQRLRELEQRWRNEYGEAMDQLRQRSDECDTLRADLAAARAEVERLRAGGCARDQRTTQWCAEAEALRQDLAAARAESAKMRRWLDDAELAERREQCRAERAEADLAAAREEIRRTHDDAEMLISAIATLREDLAAVRELLREAQYFVPSGLLRDRIDATRAEGKK